MKKTILFLLLIPLSLCTSLTFAEEVTLDQLENSVLNNNRTGKAKESLKMIIDYIDNHSDNNYSIYKALILKSYTYKSLFNYTETLKTLDEAYRIGMKTNQAEEVKANIYMEKAYAYFDILKYDEANKLMHELQKNNYKHIKSADIAGMIMQDAYIDFLHEEYESAEKKYDEAIVLMEKANPVNLPLIYGKKMELFIKTGSKEKVVINFKKGLESANKHNVLKYKIYMYEMLRELQMKENDWKAAFQSYHVIDSMNAVYNANDKNNQLKLLEKDIEIQKKDFDLNRSNLIRNFLLILCIALFSGLFLLYKFLKSNKEKKILLEKENIRIHDELQILTSNLSNQGFTKIDLSVFKLTERQLEIIELIRQGKTNKEIATTVFVSENTIKYHLKVIYEVMNIESRSEFFKLINK